MKLAQWVGLVQIESNSWVHTIYQHKNKTLPSPGASHVHIRIHPTISRKCVLWRNYWFRYKYTNKHIYMLIEHLRSLMVYMRIMWWVGLVQIKINSWVPTILSTRKQKPPDSRSFPCEYQNPPPRWKGVWQCPNSPPLGSCPERINPLPSPAFQIWPSPGSLSYGK